MRTGMLYPAMLGALSFLPGVLGWGAAGHEIIATIAEIYLHPSVLPTVCGILSTDPSFEAQAGPCHLASIATWADRVRYKMRWSAPLHYVGAVGDYPSDHCEFPGDKGWSGKRNINVLGAIRNVTGILVDWVEMNDAGRRGVRGGGVASEEDGGAAEALKFLVHFLGDLHMPLHLTGRDRGGNGDKVSFDGRVTNLHSLWDSLLIAQRIRTIGRNYTRPLPSHQVEDVLRGAIYDPYVRRIIWEGLTEGGRWESEVGTWLECPEPEVKAEKTWTESLFGFGWGQILFGNSGTLDVDDGVLCPYHWARPIHQLNCDIVWPKALDEPPYKSADISPSSCLSSECLTPESEVDLVDVDGAFVGGRPKPHEPYLELDTPEYAGMIRDGWVVERLVAMAGLRLAGLLNYLFADTSAEGLTSKERLWVYGSSSCEV